MFKDADFKDASCSGRRIKFFQKAESLVPMFRSWNTKFYTCLQHLMLHHHSLFTSLGNISYFVWFTTFINLRDKKQQSSHKKKGHSDKNCRALILCCKILNGRRREKWRKTWFLLKIPRFIHTFRPSKANLIIFWAERRTKFKQCMNKKDGGSFRVVFIIANDRVRKCLKQYVSPHVLQRFKWTQVRIFIRYFHTHILSKDQESKKGDTRRTYNRII